MKKKMTEYDHARGCPGAFVMAVWGVVCFLVGSGFVWLLGR